MWPEDYPAVSRFGDGYLLIRLIQGEGTGALESGAHVLAEADLREIALEDPVSYAAAHITGTRENGQIELFQDGRLAGVYKLQGDENLAALYDELSFGAVTEYGVQGGMPFAALSVTASPSLTVGTLRLSYALENGSFRVAHASVETPESEAVTAVVRQFAEAYFRNDPKGMAAVMTGPAVKKIAGAGEELWDRAGRLSDQGGFGRRRKPGPPGGAVRVPGGGGGFLHLPGGGADARREGMGCDRVLSGKVNGIWHKKGAGHRLAALLCVKAIMNL